MSAHFRPIADTTPHHRAVAREIIRSATANAASVTDVGDTFAYSIAYLLMLGLPPNRADMYGFAVTRRLIHHRATVAVSLVKA